jgi:hypothetical protein
MMQTQEMKKKQKVESLSKNPLFGFCPDEMVLTILSFLPLEDIQSTRVWQSKNMKQCTYAKKKNFYNLKWIHEFIGDTNFDYTFEDATFNCTGNQ